MVTIQENSLNYKFSNNFIDILKNAKSNFLFYFRFFEIFIEDTYIFLMVLNLPCGRLERNLISPWRIFSHLFQMQGRTASPAGNDVSKFSHGRSKNNQKLTGTTFYASDSLVCVDFIGSLCKRKSMVYF